MLTFAIGDIHGRVDLLRLALAEIDTFEGPKRVIFLGDYVDRGPDSREVIELLMSLNPENHIFLMGNHEELMINAIEDKSSSSIYMWHINGGKQTVESYDGPVPLEHLEWLKNLQYFFHDECGRIFVHAGIDPRKSLQEQQPEALTWIRDVFLDVAELPAYVVHGHTHTHRNKRISDTEDLPHRCNLDSGAYYTGYLSVAVFNEYQTRPQSIFQVSNAQ